MRILHVTRETSGDRRFGIGRSLLPVIEALQSLGHEARYLTQEDLGPRSRAALPRLAQALRVGAGLAFGDAGRAMALAWAERLNIGRLAAKLARAQRFDIVHLHDPWMAWGFQRARLVHPSPRALRWGLTEHGFGSYADATHEEGLPTTARLLRRLRQLEAAVLRGADWVLCPTEAARQQLARDLALPQPKPHWYAAHHARPVLHLPSRAQARKALGLAENLPMVLAVGRINPVKRLEQIVRACMRLSRRLRLVLLAAGGDAAPLHALASNAPQMELEVRLAEDIGPYLAAADLYVSAALNESFGLANLEALVAGLPCVCTAVGGVPEVSGGAAWLVPGGDEGLEDCIGQAIQALLDEPGQRQWWAAAAGRRAAVWPSALTVAQRYEAIYRGLA
jgi:glycosyltransferase involved in cell wall biosynthesis